MKQYRISYTVDTGEGNDCILDSDDPLHEIKKNMFLGSVPGVNSYAVYPERNGLETDEKINPYSQV